MCLCVAVNIRNLALEKVAEQVEFPCRFAGCTALMMAGDKIKHEVFCDFRFVFDVIMVALCNRADHYIFACSFFPSSSFFSSPNLSGRRLDVCHTSTHGVALVRI